MIGIGSDLLVISRMAAVLARRGEALANRLLHSNERLRIDRHDARAMAKAFAAKEAVAKALGTGFRQGVRWVDIETGRDELGRPVVTLHGAAAARFDALGGRQVLLSLSDERDLVLAFAVIS